MSGKLRVNDVVWWHCRYPAYKDVPEAQCQAKLLAFNAEDNPYPDSWEVQILDERNVPYPGRYYAFEQDMAHEPWDNAERIGGSFTEDV